MISVCQLICVSGRVLIIVQSANKVHIMLAVEGLERLK